MFKEFKNSVGVTYAKLLNSHNPEDFLVKVLLLMITLGTTFDYIIYKHFKVQWSKSIKPIKLGSGENN